MQNLKVFSYINVNSYNIIIRYQMEGCVGSGDTGFSLPLVDLDFHSLIISLHACSHCMPKLASVLIRINPQN